MDTVEITLPVSRAVAERWRDPQERARLGAVLSLALAAGAGEAEMIEAARLAGAPPEERERRLGEALARLQEAAAEAGLTPTEVEAELAACQVRLTVPGTVNTVPGTVNKARLTVNGARYVNG